MTLAADGGWHDRMALPTTTAVCASRRPRRLARPPSPPATGIRHAGPGPVPLAPSAALPAAAAGVSGRRPADRVLLRRARPTGGHQTGGAAYRRHHHAAADQLHHGHEHA